MGTSSFYDRGRVQSREDFFRSNAQTTDINDLFFGLVCDATPVGAKILDIGTGNGFVIEQLARRNRVKYSALYGIDISQEMLRKARSRIGGLDINLVLGDNMALPFASESFDAVTAKNVTNFSEIEVYRILKSGGKFFFREYGPGKGLREVADLFKGRLVRARHPDFYVQKLKSAGFGDVSLREFDIRREYSVEELLRVVQMFPFLDEFREEDSALIRTRFGGRERFQITSDQIIIVGCK